MAGKEELSSIQQSSEVSQTKAEEVILFQSKENSNGAKIYETLIEGVDPQLHTFLQEEILPSMPNISWPMQLKDAVALIHKIPGLQDGITSKSRFYDFIVKRDIIKLVEKQDEKRKK